MWVSNQHVIYWHHIFVVLYATLLGTLLYFAKYCKIDLLIICLEIPKFYDSSCPEVREQTWIQFHPHTHFMSLTQVKVSVCNWYSVMWQLIQVSAGENTNLSALDNRALLIKWARCSTWHKPKTHWQSHCIHVTPHMLSKHEKML